MRVMFYLSGIISALWLVALIGIILLFCSNLGLNLPASVVSVKHIVVFVILTLSSFVGGFFCALYVLLKEEMEW